MHELDRVVLAEDLPEYRLVAGDIGTIVMVYGDGEAFEVEFITLAGDTIAVVTLPPEAVRPADRHELSHARALA
jgi:hypothetical protein